MPIQGADCCQLAAEGEQAAKHFLVVALVQVNHMEKFPSVGNTALVRDIMIG